MLFYFLNTYSLGILFLAYVLSWKWNVEEEMSKLNQAAATEDILNQNSLSS